MTRIFVSLSGDSLSFREAQAELFDNSGKRILAEYYFYFRRNAEESSAAELPSGLYSLKYKVISRAEDSEFEVKILADPSTDLNCQYMGIAKKDITFKFIGTGQIPFEII